MKIRLTSDVHNEFWRDQETIWEIPITVNDAETVLVLAGDLDVGDKFFKPIQNFMTARCFDDDGFYTPMKRRHDEDFALIHKDDSIFSHLCGRFRAVIYVLGNHDVWKQSLELTYDQHRDHIKEAGLTNLHLLQNDSVQIDDILFVGGTLWTDFNGDAGVEIQDATIDHAGWYMNDYRKMRRDNYTKSVTPRVVLTEHFKTRVFIEDTVTDHDGDIIVVTHHGCSKKSVHPKYTDYLMNGSYSTNLEHIMEENSNIIGWFHGHTHDSHDYLINNCRVVCNPFGYKHYEENPNHNAVGVLVTTDGGLSYEKSGQYTDVHGGADTEDSR